METLDTTGFRITEIAGEWAVHSTDFGDGYASSVSAGHAQGTRRWSIQIPVALVDRAEYLWSFFRVSKAAGDAPFWVEMEDPNDGDRKLYLASFADHRLSYSVLCAQVYSTGLQMRQRRVAGEPSPIAV